MGKINGFVESFSSKKCVEAGWAAGLGRRDPLPDI